MRTMRAIMNTRPGGPEVLEEGELPIPVPGPGEIRVRIHAAASERASRKRSTASPRLARKEGGA